MTLLLPCFYFLFPQALAMVEIAKIMDWTYVSTVAAEGEYGEKGIASFVGLAKKHGICVAVSLKISRWVRKNHRHLSNIDSFMARTACLVCFIRTVNVRSK
jgi:hypothetical protein